MTPETLSLDWPAIIAAFFIGVGTLITALTAGAVLIMQVVYKRDVDRKLVTIDKNVNGNFKNLQRDLTLALEYLNTLQPPRELSEDERSTIQRRLTDV